MIIRTRLARTLFAILGFWSALTLLYCAADAEELPKTPFEMVRTLQALQGQVAQGNSHAHVAQRALLLQMDARFPEFDPEVWQDPRNARAAVIYLLSGGHPAVMRKLLEIKPRPQVDERLMLGALAYVEGHQEQAGELLHAFDPMSLEPGLGGQVALVRAALLVQDEPEQAIKMLDVARLLMPGSLVEEAALRREVFVAGKIGDIEKFQSLSLRYLRRYRESIYAGDFRRRFARAVETLGFAKSAPKFELLESLLNEFDGDSRRNLYLALAHHALIDGELTIVRKATAQAKSLAMKSTREEMQVRLYRAGALINVEEIPEALRLLWSLDRTKMAQEEIDLMDGIYEMINLVRHWPDPPEGTIGEFGPVSVSAKPQSADWETAIMREVEGEIATIDAMLAKAGES